VGALALAVAAAAAGALRAKVFLTMDEALELAFPGCAVESHTVYLTESQLARARELAGVEIAGAMVRPYVARCDGRAAGAAYFDTHRVRTLPETLMIVVGADGTLGRVEMLAFREPEDYIPRDTWYDQFTGERLDSELSLKRGIRGVTGATLTARATTDAVRRVLALDRVITEGGGE
jgi:Na+-translocating ferredoxin:NAD+ oxidoreductase RnfG subunit